MARTFTLLIGFVGAVAAGWASSDWVHLPFWLSIPVALLLAGFLLGLIAWLMPSPVRWGALLGLGAPGGLGILGWRAIANLGREVDRSLDLAHQPGPMNEGGLEAYGLLAALVGIAGACFLACALYVGGLQAGVVLRQRRPS
jgi:hypothetical protein